MEYEICFWLKDAGMDTLPIENLEKIRNAVEKSGGSIISEKALEKRFLAYPIKKQKTGFWGEIKFFGETSMIEKIRKALQYEDDILRKMVFELKKPKKIKKIRIASDAVRTGIKKNEISSKASIKPEEKIQVSEEVLNTKLKEILDYESIT